MVFHFSVIIILYFSYIFPFPSFFFLFHHITPHHYYYAIIFCFQTPPLFFHYFSFFIHTEYTICHVLFNRDILICHDVDSRHERAMPLSPARATPHAIITPSYFTRTPPPSRHIPFTPYATYLPFCAYFSLFRRSTPRAAPPPKD